VQYRWPIGKPRVDHLRGGIWEVRSTLKNCSARVLFAVRGEEIVLLHDFIKKTRTRRAKSSKSPSGAGKRQIINKHRGSSFDDFLKENVQAAAVKRVIAELIEEGMAREGLSKPQMAKRMGTSRSQLDRVLDPANVTIQLDTLIKAARAVGCDVNILFKPVAKATP